MGDMNVPLPLLGPLLFSMIGPIALLPLFARVAGEADSGLQRKIALSSAILALATLAIAIFIGAAVMQAAGTSRASLIIAAGIILTLTALRGIFGSATSEPLQRSKPSLGTALMPVAIPGIVTPIGVAILILFASYFPDLIDKLAILAIVAGIMVANVVAMLSAAWFMRMIGPTPLIVLGAIFGVLQVAMGIEMILSGLRLSRHFVAS